MYYVFPSIITSYLSLLKIYIPVESRSLGHIQFSSSRRKLEQVIIEAGLVLRRRIGAKPPFHRAEVGRVQIYLDVDILFKLGQSIEF